MLGSKSFTTRIPEVLLSAQQEELWICSFPYDQFHFFNSFNYKKIFSEKKVEPLG